MSVAKYLDHLEKDAEMIKEYVTKIRNGLSVVNPNEDVRKELENSLCELFRVIHFIDVPYTRLSKEAHKILGDSEANDSNDEND